MEELEVKLLEQRKIEEIKHPQVEGVVLGLKDQFSRLGTMYPIRLSLQEGQHKLQA